MKNYQLLVEYMLKKRVSMAKISPILVVDKDIHQKKVESIWNEDKNLDARRKKLMKVVLRRPLTDQEQLERSFGTS